MISITMKLVLDLGEGRLQLECLCGKQFTYAPEINEKGICPRCKAMWSGEIDEVSLKEIKLRYFMTIMKIEKGPEFVAALDLEHYAMISMHDVCKNSDPSVIMIKEITHEEFNEFVKNQMIGAKK